MKLDRENIDDTKQDRVAIHLLQYKQAKSKGEDKRAAQELDMAYKLNPSFIPAAIYRAEEYIIQRKNKKAGHCKE